MCTWIKSSYSNVVINCTHSYLLCAVSIHYNIDDGCVEYMFLKFMVQSVPCKLELESVICACFMEYDARCTVTLSDVLLCVYVLSMRETTTVSSWPWMDEQASMLLNLKLLFVFNAVWVWDRNPWCAPIQMHYNVDDGCAFMFVGCIMTARRHVGPLDKQTVRFHSCLRTWIRSCYSCSIQQCEVVLI